MQHSISGTINGSSALNADLVLQIREAISNCGDLKFSIRISLKNKDDSFIQSMIETFHNGWEAFSSFLGSEFLEVALFLFEFFKPLLE